MSSNEKKTKSAVFFIVTSVICLMVIGYFLVITGESTMNKPAEIGEMQELTQQVRGMESNVKNKEEEVTKLVDRYETLTGTDAPKGFDMMELNPGERELLERQIGEEKDVSTKSLLKEILDKKEEISGLREQIAEIENLLPTPHIAKKGESHYQIAQAFLVGIKGVGEKQAEKILRRTALFDELAEGFKVWNFYTGSEYGTSVTQGLAKVSPNVFVHRARKKLTADRDKAVCERDALEADLKSLAEKQGEASVKLDRVTKDNESLAAQVGNLTQKVNSMFYRLGSRKNLKKKGILKRGFFSSPKMKDAAIESFDRSLDLNMDDQLVISAKELGVQKIKDVVLYPKFYKKGSSYKVFITPNKKHALLTLLDKSKFKSERVVIAVR
jgi:hypothetical protein